MDFVISLVLFILNIYFTPIYGVLHLINIFADEINLKQVFAKMRIPIFLAAILVPFIVFCQEI